MRTDVGVGIQPWFLLFQTQRLGIVQLMWLRMKTPPQLQHDGFSDLSIPV